MRLIFDNYGWGTGTKGRFQGIIFPIGQNLKQPARLVEVGNATSILVTALPVAAVLSVTRGYTTHLTVWLLT